MITPHQLSSEAKQLIRSGTSETSFVKEIAEKGYFKDTRQLDQEVDVELYIHIAKLNKETYLTVQRGKHRIPTILDDDKKYFMLKFPKGMPIPDDINGVDSSFTKIPTLNTNADTSLFVF